MDNYLRRLAAFRGKLSRQQIKTLRGQILSGHGEDAMRGLEKLIKTPAKTTAGQHTCRK